MLVYRERELTYEPALVSAVLELHPWKDSEVPPFEAPERADVNVLEVH
jgi:hypothetical protein